MKPRRNGFDSTLSRNPKRVKPAMKMIVPAMPVTTPPIRACIMLSSSPDRPLSTLDLITVPTSSEPAASGPTTICGTVPRNA